MNYLLSPPATQTGPVAVVSGTFTVTLQDSPGSGTVATITPASTLAGTFTPTAVVLTDSVPTALFTFTPTVAGLATISTTNSVGMPDPAGVIYTVPSVFYAVTPQITLLDDVPLVERSKAVYLIAGQSANVNWTMITEQGIPVDLTAYVPTASPPLYPPVKLIAQEASMPQLGTINLVGIIVTPAAGLVSVTVDAARMSPAIYNADIGVFDPLAGTLGPANRFYLVCEPSAFGGRVGSGPPTRQQVRMHMRDSSPAENRLLDTVMFDDAEIAEATCQAIRIWNATLPPVAILDTSNVPAALRGGWLDGIEAVLWKFAGYWYMKNKLTTTAGGVQVNDMDKANDCFMIHEKRMADYKKWVQATKVSINIQGGARTMRSPYSLFGMAGPGY